MLEQIIQALGKVKLLLIAVGTLMLGIGLSSPPSISPLPGSHPYFRGLGAFLIILGVTLDSYDRQWRSLKYWLPHGLGALGFLVLWIIFPAPPMQLEPSIETSAVAQLETRLGNIEATIEANPTEGRTAPPTSTVEAASAEPEWVDENSPQPRTTPTPPEGMVMISRGSFLMGSDSLGAARAPYPQHQETVEEFWVHVYEVSNAEYQECVDAIACTQPFKTSSPTHPQYFVNSQFSEYPVIWVSYRQAAQYCDWIGAQLPTEAQWERAARGTEGRTYPWGNDPPVSGDHSNLGIQGALTDVARRGSFASDKTPEGAFDLAGNVSEWTQSWFVSYERNVNPFDNTGSLRIVKGANYRSFPDTNYPKSFFRQATDPSSQEPTVGFRCVWQPEQD